MIHEQIRGDLTKAMKAKDAPWRDALRNVLTAFVNELVSQGKKPNDMLDDDSATAVLKRLAKQRKDAISRFREGGRDDLVQQEEQELDILSDYLPAMMSREEIAAVARAKKEELGIRDASDAGRLVGAVMKEAAGRADGKDVKEVVEQIL